MEVPDSRRRMASPSYKAFTEAMLLLNGEQEPPTLYFDVAELASEIRGKRVDHTSLKRYARLLEADEYAVLGERRFKHDWQDVGHERVTIALTESGLLHVSVIHLVHLVTDNSISVEKIQENLLGTESGRIALSNLASFSPTIQPE